MKQLIGYFDGCCEPVNPGGNMGVGACFFLTADSKIKKADEVFTYSDFYEAGRQNSNNVAEYLGFKSLLEWLEINHTPKEHSQTVQIWGDSKMVIMQMTGAWKIKAGYYVPIAQECKKLLAQLKGRGLKFQIAWHRRELNHYADELSKATLINNNVTFKIQPL